MRILFVTSGMTLFYQIPPKKRTGGKDFAFISRARGFTIRFIPDKILAEQTKISRLKKEGAVDENAKKEWDRRVNANLNRMITALNLADNAMDEAINSAAKIVRLFQELKIKVESGAGRDDNGKFFVEFLLTGPDGQQRVIRVPSYDDSFLDSMRVKL